MIPPMVHSLGNICRKVVIGLILQFGLGSADCECGYRITYNGNSSEQSGILYFTNAVKTDFRVMHILNESVDWKLKQLVLDYIPDKGRFGRLVEERNVILNPLKDISAGPSSPSVQGTNIDAGLQLLVRSKLVGDNMVSTGQIQSQSEDVRFGSFRAYMKTSPINGTCAASFWYHNDSQEIDIELLSRQQKEGKNPINLSVHSEESVANDYDATNTTGFIESQLGFDPAEGFHEYRYDWSADVISFYTDNRWLGDIHNNIPQTAGYFQLNHWSNGFAGWSAGPPRQDAMLTVAYFNGYFNTTDPVRSEEFEVQCGGSRHEGKVCDVSEFVQPLKSLQISSTTPHSANTMLLLFFGLAAAFYIW